MEHTLEPCFQDHQAFFVLFFLNRVLLSVRVSSIPLYPPADPDMVLVQLPCAHKSPAPRENVAV